jgi:hypothetical protein
MPSSLDSRPFSSGAQIAGLRQCGPTIEAYNLFSPFSAGGKGLTNFLHLRTGVRMLYGKALAADADTRRTWL